MNEQPSFQSGVASAQLNRVIDAIARWSVYLAVLLIPLFYLPWTVEGLELSKQLLLIVLTAVGVMAWLGKMLLNRRVEFRRSVMNLLIGVYLVVYAASAWFSRSRYGSLVGDFGQEKAGLVTLTCFVLLYFVAINVLKGAKEVRMIVWLTIVGGFVAVAHAYLQALGLRMFSGQAAESGSFNLVGTSNALGVYAGMLLAMLMGLFLTPEENSKWKLVRNVLMGLLGVLSLLYVASLSFWALWLVVIVGSAVFVGFGLWKADKVKRVTMLSLPMAAVVIGILFSFVRFPISFGAPAEVMPSMSASWKIAREALASTPLLGSGPGTFLYDYAQFRSKELNQTAFWSVHFDRSTSRVLTLLATTGILGLAAFVLMVGFLGTLVVTRLMKSQDEWLLTLTVFGAWLGLLTGKVFYSSNMTLEFMFWMMTAMLVILEWDKWQEARFENSPRAALISSFLLIVAAIFSVAGLYLEGQRYVAEKHYSKAVTMGLTKIEDVDKAIESLVRATQLNGQNDLYFRTLSQSLTLRTNLEVQKVGAKPTDDDARRIALLAANAVNAGKRATDLNPDNVQNWSSLAGLYRDLAGSTPGASDAAENAYGQAIKLEPNNPIYHTDLGRVYLSLADAATPGLQSKVEEEKAAAQKTLDENLAKAKENLEKAVEAKSDYANAHYWLAVTLQRMGKTDEAVKKLEAVRDLNPEDLGIGFQLGILYYQNNQKDKAMAELERVIARSPSFSNARWYLASMYEEAGKMDDAIAQVQEVLKHNKDNETVKQRLAELEAKKSGQPVPTAPGLPNPVEPPKEGQVIAPAPAPKP